MNVMAAKAFLAAVGEKGGRCLLYNITSAYLPLNFRKPSTAKISLVILLTVSHRVLIKLVRKIRY